MLLLHNNAKKNANKLSVYLIQIKIFETRKPSLQNN